MNASEGRRRIATAIRWAGKGLLVIFVAIGISLSMFGKTSDSTEVGVVCAIGGAICIGGCYALAWIVDGFAAPRREQ